MAAVPSITIKNIPEPLYRAMKETDQIDMALDIYGKARPGYHSVATGTMDALLDWPGEDS